MTPSISKQSIPNIANIVGQVLYLKMRYCGLDKPCIELKVIKVLSFLYLQAFLIKLFSGSKQTLKVFIVQQSILTVSIPRVIQALPWNPLNIFSIPSF